MSEKMLRRIYVLIKSIIVILEDISPKNCLDIFYLLKIKYAGLLVGDRWLVRKVPAWLWH